MELKGIRIEDLTENGIVSVKLPDILKEIPNGNSFFWSILYLYVLGPLKDGLSIDILEKQINGSEKGLFITWNDLNILSNKFHQIIDITIIGCKDKNLLRRYETDQEIYEMCDIVIEMIDSSYWEVFSKDIALINRLAIKFNDVKFLEPK